MIRCDWRFQPRPCHAQIVDNPLTTTGPPPPPVVPPETCRKVIAWANEAKGYIGKEKELIAPFTSSSETCQLDKERHDALSTVGAYADVVILNGDRALSAIATGVLVASRAAISGWRDAPSRGNRRWVVIVGSANEAVYVQNMLQRVYPDMISSVYVKGVDVPVYTTSTTILSPIHPCASGIIVMPETAIKLLTDGEIGSYICEDAGGLMESPAMLHFMELAKREMRTVKIDDREYTAKDRKVGRVVIMSNLREERIEHWSDLTMRLRNAGINVSHHVSLPNSPIGKSPENIQQPMPRPLKRSNTTNVRDGPKRSNY